MSTRQSHRLCCEALESRLVLATFQVSSIFDGAPNSFRDAIEQANALPGEDTIEFAPQLTTSTSYLDDGPIAVTDSLIIDGAQVNGEHRIHANGGIGILDIQGTSGMQVTIRDLMFDGTIQDLSGPITTFPAQIKSRAASLHLEHVSIVNTVVPTGYEERTSAIVASGEDIDITIRDSLISGNAGGVQLANRNAVRLNVYGGSQISVEGTTIEQSVGYTRGFDAYLSGESTIRIVDSSFTENHEGGASIGLYGSGSVEVINSRFEANDGFYGPGLAMRVGEFGSALLTGNVINGNAQSGLAVGVSGTLDASDNVVTGNSMMGSYGSRGVSIYAEDSSLVELRRMTISGNASPVIGGGIWIGAEDNSRVVVSESLISGNQAEGQGGGAYIALSDNGTVEIVNSTVSGNTSLTHGGGVSLYGVVGPEQFVLRHSTVNENESGGYGGGIYAPYFTGYLTTQLSHSIVANNTSTFGFDDVGRLYFDPTRSGFNIIGNGYGTNLIDGYLGNQVGTSASPIDPMLGGLADNGGPTMTHALLTGSLAIDAGNPDLASGPVTDQRGLPFQRVAFGRVDVGAFEVQPTTNGDFDADGDFDCDDIDQLVAAIATGSSNSDFDLNGDLTVDLADIDVWLMQAAADRGFAAPLLHGDANLDGVVDGLDFIIWNENRFTANAAWCAGDFNADGNVDGVDFIIWNGNKFQSALDLVLGEFSNTSPVEEDVSSPEEAPGNFSSYINIAAWKRVDLAQPARRHHHLTTPFV